MPFSVEPHYYDHIITSSVGDDFNINSEIGDYLRALIAALDEMPGQSVCIIDTTGLNINFGSMTGALSLITHGELAFLKHPNIRAMMVITENSLVVMGVNALHQGQYGHVRTEAVKSMDEALTRAGEELAIDG